MDAFADALGASVAALFSAAAIYPVELVKNRVATGGLDNESVADAVVALYRAGGIRRFFKGVSVSVAGNGIEKFIYFFAYSELRRLLSVILSNSQLVDLFAGSLAEWCHLPLTMPVDVFLVRSGAAPPHESVIQVFQGAVASKGGMKGLYSGISAYPILCWKPGIQQLVFEFLKSRQLTSSYREVLSSAQAFTFGAVARSIATVMLYPYIAAKVKVQIGHGKKAASNPLWELQLQVFAIARSDGLPGLFKGMPQELVRATLSAALLFMFRERISLTVRKAIVG